MICAASSPHAMSPRSGKTASAAPARQTRTQSRAVPVLLSAAVPVRRGRSNERAGRHLPCLLYLPALQHDLAAGLAGFQQRMRALEIGGVDGAEGLVERGAQHALVDEIGDVVEQIVLADHVRRLE